MYFFPVLKKSLSSKFPATRWYTCSIFQGLSLSYIKSFLTYMKYELF